MFKNLINQGYKVKSNNISFLHHPKEYKEKLLELIAKANKRILFNCLYLENDESGQEILSALKEAVTKKPNLQVDICLDLHRAQRNRLGENKESNNASWYLESLKVFNDELIAKNNLKRPPIRIFGIPANGRELLGVYHIKGYVFDDILLYSGASINNNYCAFKTYRLDRYEVINDQALANSFYEFSIKNFTIPLNLEELDNDQQSLFKTPCQFSIESATNKTKGQRLVYKSYRQNHLLSPEVQYDFGNAFNFADIANDEVIVCPIYGLGKNNLLNQTVFNALTEAKKTITIYTPYFNFTKSLTKKIIECCNRGVKIKIIVSNKVANDFYTDPEDPNFNIANALPYLYETNLFKFVKTHLDIIIQGNLEVYSWKDGKNSYHNKGIIIDDQCYIFTGSNLNRRSFNIDVENALVCLDPHKTLKEKADQEYEFVSQHLTLIDDLSKIESKKDYPLKVRKILKRASYFFIDRLAKRLF